MMLRLPPEANPYTSKPWAGNSDHEAFNQGADAQLRHCLEKVREFLKLWDGATEDSLEFEQNYGVRWDTELVEAFDSWLSHEKGE